MLSKQNSSKGSVGINRYPERLMAENKLGIPALELNKTKQSFAK